MSRTQSKYYADAGHAGGFTFIPGGSCKVDSANLAWTRNANGDYSLNRTAAGAETYHIVADLTSLLRKRGTGADWLAAAQEQFGGSGSGILNAPGRPPYSGQSQLAIPTAMPPKGILIQDVFLVYSVGVVALTSLAVSLNATTYANNVAPAVVNMPQNAVTYNLTAQANPYLITGVVTTPAYINTDLSNISVDATVVMANTGTFRFYGFGVHFDFNFN